MARTTIAGAVLVAALGACSSGPPSTPSGTAPGAATSSAPAASGPSNAAVPTITMSNFAFGQPLSVKPGTTITVVNEDSAPHNVTAANGSFRTNTITKGQTTTFVAPSAVGTYAFTCTIHPRMQGMLIVSDTARAAGPPPAGTAADHSGHSGGEDTSAPGGGSTY